MFELRLLVVAERTPPPLQQKANCTIMICVLLALAGLCLLVRARPSFTCPLAQRQCNGVDGAVCACVAIEAVTVSYPFVYLQSFKRKKKCTDFYLQLTKRPLNQLDANFWNPSLQSWIENGVWQTGVAMETMANYGIYNGAGARDVASGAAQVYGQWTPDQ